MILFVDDEERFMSSYFDELREALPGYKILCKYKVDDALSALRENADRIELLILDIMMAPGVSFSGADTTAGLRTGIRFYELARQINPAMNVIIFTNISDSSVEDYFDKEEKCLFLRKENHLPFEFAERVKEVLGEA
jgi:DNA-binding NarL/FixJ family response regulator